MKSIFNNNKGIFQMFLSVPIMIGLILIIVGLGIFLMPKLGSESLTWFKTGSNIVDIDVNNKNQLTYDVTNTEKLRGAVGVIALFTDDDFKRADYFYTKTNGNLPQKSVYSNRFTTVINLTDYVEPGNHTIKVCREITHHYMDRSSYDINEYWNMKSCGYDWNTKKYNDAELDQNTKNFNFKWLPCSRTRIGKHNPILPEHALGFLGDSAKTQSFYYEDLLPVEIEMFSGLTCNEFEINIQPDKLVVIEPVIIEDIEENTMDEDGKTTWWDDFVAFFSNIKLSI